MKRVGIITYHHYYNYGTMLQALALQIKIEQLGYEAELIDFKQDISLSRYELIKLRFRRLPVYIRELGKYNVIKKSGMMIEKRKKLFEQFYKKYLNVSDAFYINTEQLIENPPIYDGYIVGSDQTWNPYSSNAPQAFFLPFVVDNSKKGSYAPSIAVERLPIELEEKYKERLSSFSFLSCREKSGTKLLEKITGRKVQCVLDPTLLLHKSDWDRYSEDIDIKKPYMLVYFLGENKEHRKFIKNIQEVTGLRVISIPMAYLEMGNNEYEKVWCGPGEFISLVKGATVVCTDSFHGTIFSINFRKDFYVFCKHSNSDEASENSRLHNVLDTFGLSDRLIKSMDNFNELSISIKYDDVDIILENERKKSIGYLKNMLEEITK